MTREVTKDEINAILSTSIKRDDDTKFIAFCNNLLAQTRDDQMNISYQADSSAGKSYIPLEVAMYFPKEEVIEIASASPAAFFHERGSFDSEKKAQIVDLEGKIIIFLDQQHFRLQEKMRSILSHDKKELLSMITDKSDRKGLRTKNVIIRGFASFHFCTTRIDPDEQEKTRMLQLSPSTDPQKIMESLELIALRKGNPEEYSKQILQDPRRPWLTNRILAIRQSGIKEIIIPDDAKLVCERFKKDHPHLIGRHQRDFPRLLGLIKSHALLNCFTREKKSHDTIIANEADIDAGFALYNEIGESNEIGVSPYLYDIYKDVISSLFETNRTLTRDEILRKYYQVRHKPLDPDNLGSNILPQLQAVGLIIQDPDPQDKRRMLVCKPDTGQKYMGNDMGGKSSAEQSSTSIQNDKIYPHLSTHISQALWEIYDRLERQNEADGSVGEEVFRIELITWKLTASEATQTINDMVAAGELVRPEWGN